MHHARTVIVLLAAAGAALTGCSSGGSPHPAATHTTATKPAAPSHTVLIAQCVAAIAAGKDDTDTGAPECNRLTRGDYETAIHEANENAQKAFNDATDAGASATP